MIQATTDLRALVREIPDFPKEGVGFKDITPLLADPRALQAAVRGLAEYARPLNVDCVIAAEARGFLLGPALALELGAGFVLARKPGKLPYETVSAEYLLEYGAGELELHTDALGAGRPAGARARRPARHGRHREGAVRARREPRRRGRRLRFSDRARVPARTRATRAPRRPRADLLRVLTHGHETLRATLQRTDADGEPHPHDLRPGRGAVGDDPRPPPCLPRWWPRVNRVEDVTADEFTEVLITGAGKYVRADFTLAVCDERERRLCWEQRLEGSRSRGC